MLPVRLGEENKKQTTVAPENQCLLPFNLQGFTKGDGKGHLAPVLAKEMWIRVTTGQDFNFTKICKGKEEKAEGKKKITCREHEYQGRHA